MTIKEMRTLTGLSQVKFAEFIGTSRRNIENWESDKSPGNCPDYVLQLIEYKLKNEKMI